MKVGVLYSGGKDSNMALFRVLKKHKVRCLICFKSENEESYMFHVPNIDLTKKQAELIGLPLIFAVTKGKEEEELKDLRDIIKIAKDRFEIEGIVSGAIASNYQKSRIDNICKELGLESIAPLWHVDYEGYLREIIENKFEVIITGIAADGLSEKWLGRKIDEKFIEDIKKLNEKNKINISGEGGEYETIVLNSPFFKKGLEVSKAVKKMENEFTGILELS